MTRKRIIIFITVLLGIILGAFLLIKIGQGYRPDFSTKQFRPTGLLIATSTPNQASIYIDGKIAKVKTPSNLNLAPGEYEIEIKKDGFTSWKKKILIEKELVAKTEAYLFPNFPSLNVMTSTGASSPVISPDGKKVVFAVANYESEEKNGLWVLNLSDRPLGLGRDPLQILQSAPKGRQFEESKYQWSPDSEQILVTLNQDEVNEENFLVEADRLNPATELIDVTNQLLIIRNRWQDEQDIIKKAELAKLPEELIMIFEDNTQDISFSPDATKIMFTATASAVIPKELIPPLPGASNQPEAREITTGNIYVYDIKEDRNFFIMEAPVKPQADEVTPAKQVQEDQKQAFSKTVSWFPTSKNIFIVQEDRLSMIEYDGTNFIDIYSGPFENSFAFPFPSGTRILILTSLNNENIPPNLYAVSVR